MSYAYMNNAHVDPYDEHKEYANDETWVTIIEVQVITCT